MKLPPDPAPVEKEILDFFASNNFERSRRFAPGRYDPAILREFLSQLGNPQWRYRTFHIAGTVAKGSVTTLLARALVALGLRTGCYLSPHFVSLRERITLNGAPIPAADLARLWQFLCQQEGLEKLSFFDAMTAMAFLYFAEVRCDAAVIETGLGGRLDSTNNLKAEFAVLTPVGFDHMAILGDTLTAIAREKAGIIHAGQKVFSFPQHPEVLQVLKERCDTVSATLRTITPEGDDFNTQNRNFVLKLVYEYFRPDEKALHRIQAALAEPIFGRWSVLREKPRIIFDSAHNLPAVAALKVLLEREPNPCNVFINTMQERDLVAMVKLLQDLKKIRCFFFPMPQPQFYQDCPPGLIAASDNEICELISDPEKTHLFTGSMAIYAELRQHFGL
ncbi:MAG: hypothetical protein NZL89_04535 [Leptospiraceae bacterium]|nr:hypothetical protein [Leptospiraceae bacterium]